MKKETSALTLRLDPMLHKQLKSLAKEISKQSGQFVSANLLAENAIRQMMDAFGGARKLDRKK